MNVDQMILIFFRLFNFAVVLGIFVHVWRRYGRTYIMAEYEKWHEYLIGLQQAYVRLHEEDTAVRNEYADDEQERSALKERLFAWRDAVQKQEQSLADEKEARENALNKRIKAQVHRVQEYRLYHQIQKEAIQQVRDRLREEYSSKAAQKQIVESILKRLDAA
ncbi:MAG: hypothetical protein ACD_64C00213G0004 [uncultured bacterium]|nr:MAG: hypothetical protein ACD_64C00213G0004 [uncultured bacterium]